MKYHSLIISILISFFIFTPNVYSQEVADDAPKFYGDIFRIDSQIANKVINELEEAGGESYYHRGDLYLIVYPADYDIYGMIAETEDNLNPGDSEDFEAGKNKTSVKRESARDIKSRRDELRRKKGIGDKINSPTMENARFAFGADKLYSGEGLPGIFDGSGIVVGFSDLGFDTRHSNFLTKEGDRSRVMRYVNYDIRKGKRDILTTPEAIAEYLTDNKDEYHATHVGGILAGRGTSERKYIGMAPGAEIVATTSTLQDVEILAGVEDIISYAKEVGKPAVINLSLGYYGGPHDGTSLFSQYLDLCAEDAIICLSTGNEGVSTNHIGYTFKGESDRLVFKPSDTSWDYLEVSGSIDIYSADDTPLKLSMIIEDSATGGTPAVYSTPTVDFNQDPMWVLTSDPELGEIAGCHYDKNFAEYFDGLIVMTGEIDEYNGRYHVKVEWAAKTDIVVSDSKKWGRYQLAGILEGPDSTTVDLYADGINSSFRKGGTVKADSQNSFSDLCSGRNVISVGAYLTAESIPTMGGWNYEGGTPLTVCDFSSYGATTYGRVIPMTIAPGAPIVSSFSGAFVAENGVELCAFEDKGHYWGIESGTSMSSPYVSGVIATWLQANPNLGYKDIQRIIEMTNRQDPYSLTANPRHGQGAIDPYSGLKLILEESLTSVEEIIGKSLFAEFNCGLLRIFNPDRREVRIEIYTLDGRKIDDIPGGAEDMITLTGEELNMEKGLMICKVSAPGAMPAILKFANQ